MSKGKIALIIGLLVVAVVGYGCFKLSSSITETPQTFIVGEAFVEHLAAGEIDEASALAVPELQSEEAKEALRALVADYQPLFSASTQVHFSGRGIYNDIRYASGTITSGTTESPIYMEFMDVNGETRVNFITFREEDIPDYSNSAE